MKLPPARVDAGTPQVTRALTNAFLVTKAARERIREVVEARMPGEQESDVEDVCQQALEKALTTTELARSVAALRPWVSRIAQNAAIDHLRRGAKHIKWLDRSVDAQELPPDPAMEGEDPADERRLEAVARPSADEDDARGMLGRWIDRQPLTKADRLTLEMIRDQAKNGGTNADLAARYGMTVAAWDNRLLRFKGKYVERWKRHRERQLVLLLIGVALALVVAVLVGRWLRGREEPPTPAVVPERVAPSASAAPAPAPAPAPEDRFNQAAPTDAGPSFGGKP